MNEKKDAQATTPQVPPPPTSAPAAEPETATTGQAPDAQAGSTGWSSPFGTATPPPGDASTAVFGAPGQPPTQPPTQAPPTTAEPHRGRMLLAGLAVGAILGGGAGAGVATVLDDDPATPTTRSSLDAGASGDSGSTNSNISATSDVAQVAQQVLPSVVSISVQTQFGGAGGTGVIISSDGEILTNNHVVEGAGQGGTVQVTFSDGTTADAEVLGTDPLTDLAVIKASDVSGLTPAELGTSSDVTVGQQVVAIGSPLGLEGTVTTGIISALNRPVQAGDGTREGSSVIDAMQTDAPINPGNSGGPLVNMAGQVIGINSAIATTGSNSGSIGLGFSIPIDQAKPIAEELLDGDQATHARIGIGVGDPRDGSRGALVASVEDGSGGAEAGLQEGDVITKIDDRVITSGASLIAAARSHRPGDTVTITYLRDGEEHDTELTLGSDAQSS